VNMHGNSIPGVGIESQMGDAVGSRAASGLAVIPVLSAGQCRNRHTVRYLLFGCARCNAENALL
jgi:hypothetical protein